MTASTEGQAAPPRPVLQDAVDALLAAPAALVQLRGIRQLGEYACQRTHSQCVRCGLVFDSWTSLVHHLDVTEREFALASGRFGPIAQDGLHRPGDVRVVTAAEYTAIVGVPRRVVPPGPAWLSVLCRFCRLPVIWVVLDSGSRLPVDEYPVPGGNVALAAHPDPAERAPLARFVSRAEAEHVDENLLRRKHNCPPDTQRAAR